MAGTHVLLAVVALGLSAGALLAEACVLVPFWRALPPERFLAWYRENAGLLLHFFGPLEAVAAALPIAAAAWMRWGAGEPRVLIEVSALLALSVLGAFPLYFGRANASFADGSLSAEQVAPELQRWARWHWARVIAAGAAFVLGALGAAQ